MFRSIQDRKIYVKNSSSTTSGSVTGSGTADYFVKWNTPSTVTNGTWKFNGNNIEPLTAGSAIGSTTKYISDFYLGSATAANIHTYGGGVLKFTFAGTVKAQIDTSGFIAAGGTHSPIGLFDGRRTGLGYLASFSDGSNGIAYYTDSNGVWFGNDGTAKMIFYTDGNGSAPAFKYEYTGGTDYLSVGIALATTPTARFTSASTTTTSASSAARFQNSDNSKSWTVYGDGQMVANGDCYITNQTTAGTQFIRFTPASGIQCDGGALYWQFISDIKFNSDNKGLRNSNGNVVFTLRNTTVSSLSEPVDIGKSLLWSISTQPAVASNGTFYVRIDANNDTGNAKFIVEKDAGTTLWTINEDGVSEWIESSGGTTSGMRWYDSTQKAFSSYSNGLKQIDSTVIFEQTATATVANTTTETTLLSTLVPTSNNTIPANFLVAGKTIMFEAAGTIADTSTPTMTIKFKIGSTIVLNTGAVAIGTLTGTKNWKFKGTIVCRSTGASGSVSVDGIWMFESNVLATPGQIMIAVQTVTVDTTISNALGFTAQWSAASASNTISCLNASAEILN